MDKFISKAQFEQYTKEGNWNEVAKLMYQIYDKYIWGKKECGLHFGYGNDKHDFDDIKQLVVITVLKYLKKHYKEGLCAWNYAYKGIVSWVSYYQRENSPHKAL